MMKSYNSRIIPVVRDKTDRLYVSDVEQSAPAKYPNDERVRTCIDLYRKTGQLSYRDKIIAWFGRYVVSIAKNYQEQGLPLSDLISEGMIGLIAAVDQFDLKREDKFVTYSNTCISRQMREALDQFNRPVKVPKNIRNHQNKTWERLHRHSLEGKDIMDTIEESSDHEKVFVLNPKAYHKKRIKRVGAEDFSENIGNVLEDHKMLSEQFSSKIDKEDLLMDLNRVLTLVTDDEKKVILYFYGIGNDGPYTLTNISEKLGMTLDRVRKLKVSGLQKLKTEKSLKILAKYL